MNKEEDLKSRVTCCTGCDQLTSDNACRLGALYGMKRCIRTPNGLDE